MPLYSKIFRYKFIMFEEHVTSDFDRNHFYENLGLSFDR